MTTPSTPDILAAALQRHRLAATPDAQHALTAARAAWSQPAAHVLRFWPLLVAAAALVVCDLGMMQILGASADHPLPARWPAPAAATVGPAIATTPTHGGRLTLSALEHHAQESNP